MDIRGLLLCGGRSTRFGTDKLLAPLDGRPLVAHAAANMREGVGNVLAVIGAGNRQLREALEAAGCEILETDRVARGMGSSLAAAVEAADGADGWIVALGDMPRIEAQTARAVRDAIASGARIAAPVERRSGRRGHPVGFAASLRNELLALDGDVGARELLARFADDVVAVLTDDPGIVVDVDTDADLKALR